MGSTARPSRATRRTLRAGLRRVRGTAATLAAATLLAGCGVPIPPELPDTTTPRGDGAGTGGEAVDRLVPSDDGSATLVAAIGTLTAQVRAARDLLAAGEGGPAVDALLGAGTPSDPASEPASERRPGVVPAIAPDRATSGSDDLVTLLITLAGDVGGERSRIVMEVVRDPMLGDLGAWQRDPVGVIELLRATASEAVGTADDGDGLDAAALDAALLELPGELTRALGYALVVAADPDGALAGHAALQGAGRLDIVVIALELAAERIAARP